MHALDRHDMVGSMGRVGAAGDNAAMESFFSLLQKNVLDRRTWTTRVELANAVFEWIEAFYNPIRRHSALATSPRSSSNAFTPPPEQRHDKPPTSGIPWAGQSCWHLW